MPVVILMLGRKENSDYDMSERKSDPLLSSHHCYFHCPSLPPSISERGEELLVLLAGINGITGSLVLPAFIQRVLKFVIVKYQGTGGETEGLLYPCG